MVTCPIMPVCTSVFYQWLKLNNNISLGQLCLSTHEYCILICLTIEYSYSILYHVATLQWSSL